MACAELVIRVKRNIQSTVGRIYYAHSGKPSDEAGMSGQGEKSQLQRLCIHNVLYFVYFLALCESPVGPWIFTYVFINTVCVCVCVLFSSQTDLPFSILCSGNRIFLPCSALSCRRRHRMVIQYVPATDLCSKENIIIKNILFVCVVVVVGGQLRTGHLAMHCLHFPSIAFSPIAFHVEISEQQCGRDAAAAAAAGPQ